MFTFFNLISPIYNSFDDLAFFYIFFDKIFNLYSNLFFYLYPLDLTFSVIKGQDYYINLLLFFIFFFLLFFLAALLLFLSYFLGTFLRFADQEKMRSYECGFDSFYNNRDSFNIHFFRICLLFLLFDLEVIYLVPWTVLFFSTTTNIYSFLFIFFFFVLFFIFSFLYEYFMGVLDLQQQTKSNV